MGISLRIIKINEIVLLVSLQRSFFAVGLSVGAQSKPSLLAGSTVT